MMSDNRLQDIENNWFNKNEWSNVNELVSEIKRLRTENADLKRRLAVFTDGMPSKSTLHIVSCAIVDGHLSGKDYMAFLVSDWLRRIAAIEEVKS